MLPRIARGVTGLGPFLVRSMRPGEHPAARMGELLAISHGGEAIDTPADAIAALLAGRAARLVGADVIDQLEELFTLAEAASRSASRPRCVPCGTSRAA